MSKRIPFTYKPYKRLYNICKKTLSDTRKHTLDKLFCVLSKIEIPVQIRQNLVYVLVCLK